MRYAEKLYKHMLLKGFNQQKLARLSGVSDSEVSRILSGKSHPSLEYASRLARALEISLDYLADDALDEDPRRTVEATSAHELEVLELVRTLGPRPARRLLETACDLGYEVAIRRLLGAERPLIEVGDGRIPVAPSKPASGEGRAHSA